MAAKRAPRHRHKYQRLSDEALFCECGATKDVRPAPVHYCNHWCTHTWRYYPTYPWTPTITWGDVTTGATTLVLDDNTTLTVWNGTAQ